MISCLMVTQPGREALCAAAIECFSRQTFTARELVIVHDGDTAFDQTLQTLASGYPDTSISIYREASASLGALRNISVARASFPIVCQWDDDDLSHPERLSLQYQHISTHGADFCLLTNQLHLFTRERILFWDDWSVESWPGNLIQGTLMGRRDLMPHYPDKAVGEDTDLLHAIVANGGQIEAMQDNGWMTIYQYHGDNAWDEDHHKAISRWKRRRYRELESALPELTERLREYGLPYGSLSLLHERGRTKINL